MIANVGKTDRIIRAVAGLVVLSLFFSLDSNIRYVGLLGLVLLGTAAIGYCPPYAWLGINTCASKK